MNGEEEQGLKRRARNPVSGEEMEESSDDEDYQPEYEEEDYYDDEGDDEDAYGEEDDDADDASDATGSDLADVVPDVSEAMSDPLFRAMCNHMLEAAQAINKGLSGKNELDCETNLLVTEDAFSELQIWVWEHIWLPHKGFVNDELSETKSARSMPQMQV